MEPKKFDIVVLGGGPAGYPAAIRAAQAGKSVALIEAKELGGTCLNRGCIPSKALIADANTYQHTKEAQHLGILTGKAGFDFSRMAKRKDQVVNGLRKGVEGLMAANKITLFRGYGKFVAPYQIKVMGSDNVLVEGKKIIIATGSEPRNIPAFPFDYERIHDSTSLLALEKLPKSIVIIGGGVIGCEFASLYAALDCEVTILELMPRIIPMEDKSVADVLKKALEKKGVKIVTEANVQGIEKSKDGVKVLLAAGQSHAAEMALVSVGRKLNTNDIGLDKAGIVPLDNGLIPVDDRMETAVPDIYAVGDIASKWWLAHVATHQGIVAASNAIGHPMKMLYNAIPSVIFTSPEIGTVGLTLEAAQKAGCQAVVAAFPFLALGKSQAIYHTDGFAQIVHDKRTGQILGAQVVGYDAATLVAEMGVAIANELTIESIADTIHAHPTVAEAWMEAADLALGLPIHLPPRTKRGSHG